MECFYTLSSYFGLSYSFVSTFFINYWQRASHSFRGVLCGGVGACGSEMETLFKIVQVNLIVSFTLDIFSNTITVAVKYGLSV